MKRHCQFVTKITIILLLLSHADDLLAQSDSKITIRGRNIQIREAFEEVEKQTGTTIAYNQTRFDATRRRTLEITNAELDTAMKMILSGTGFTYKKDGNYIAIVEAQAEQEKPAEKSGQKQYLGTVTDRNGNPLVGATVVLQGAAHVGTTSDHAGMFVLSASPGNSLQVSYLGYITTTVQLGENQQVTIIMTDDSQLIDDVVIVGFGTQKRATMVGSVESIKPRELRTPSSSLVNSMAGRIAGIISVQRGGEPGADGANFWIRGISTFNKAAADPLIFIDGIEVSVAELNALSPEVIDNFSVLKDASATALYGARGANGVMLVTTRQGTDTERASVNIRVENSFTSPTRTVKLANGVAYMRGFNEAIMMRDPSAAPRFDEDTKILPTERGENGLVYPNVDWSKELFKNFATTQTVNLNVSGGGKKVTYFLNALVNNDNGMIKKDKHNNFDNSIDYRRISLQGNISANITKTTKVILRLNSQISRLDGSSYGTPELYRSIFMAPPTLFPSIYPNTANEDHILFGNAKGGPVNWYGVELYRNPYAEMVSGYKELNESTINSSLELEQDLGMLVPGLKLKGLISFKNNSATQVVRTSIPFFYGMSDFTIDSEGNADYELELLSKGETALVTTPASWGDRLNNFQVMLDYNDTFGRHSVGAMLVYMQRSYNVNNPADYYSALPVRNQGLSGRVTYNYDSRYLLEANFGYNGSENLAPDRHFGFFPSVAVGYLISNETFFEPLINVFSNLKLRASYGMVGSSFTNPKFPYLTFVYLSDAARRYTFGNNWDDTRDGTRIAKLGTPDAHWEKGWKFNVGIDLGFFKNSLNISFDWFREIRSDIFMQRRVIPVESGISAEMNPWGNIGKVKNQGFELSAEYYKPISRNWDVSFRGNVSFAKNMLIDRDEPMVAYPYLSDINQSLNRYRGLVALGYFQDQADIDNSPVQTFTPREQLRPGDIKYADLNGDNKIDNLDTRQMGYPTIPQVTFGFGASVRYWKFDFSFFFQGVARTSLMMNDIHPYTPNGKVLMDFIARDHWTETRTEAEYPRLAYNQSPAFNNYQPSSFWLRDASFIRLKNVELGFSHKMLRVYIAGQNLLTFSAFKHWDPELGGWDISYDRTNESAGGNGMSYPNLRMMTIGVQLTF